MKILHTADLHLGRQFNGLSLEEDHAEALDQILAALTEHDVDVLVIAGDIFDRAVPPASAVRQFNGFLARIERAAVVMIAGNHDSADRISAMSALQDRRRVLIRGAVSASEPPLVLHDAHGPVAFSALPFSYEYAAQEAFNDPSLDTPEAVLRAQVEAARAALPEGARWVIAAHAFVAGAQGSESERPLARVGGIETVSPEIFAGADYVALGHLHRPQAIAPHIRYSGAPLAFGFDEAGAEKSFVLLQLSAGAPEITLIPIRARRQVRALDGAFDDLLKSPPSDDFIKITLTDSAPVIDAMKRLRAVFPNACHLSYAPLRAPEVKSFAPRAQGSAAELLQGFLDLVGEGVQEGEISFLINELHELERSERAQ